LIGRRNAQFGGILICHLSAVKRTSPDVKTRSRKMSLSYIKVLLSGP
jgi:hypothetical protein